MNLDFPVFVTDGSANFLSPPIAVGNRNGMRVRFRLSILAKQGAQILLTGHESWVDFPGIIINIDTHTNPGSCWLQKCAKVKNDFQSPGCNPSHNLVIEYYGCSINYIYIYILVLIKQFTVKVNPEVTNQWVHVDIVITSTTPSNGINSVSLTLHNDHGEVSGKMKIDR